MVGICWDGELLWDGDENIRALVIECIENPNVKPFFEFFLPEKNVISITSLIQKDGVNYQSPPTYDEFISSPDKWYEVDALAESKIFIEDPTRPADKPGLKVGKYIDKKYANKY